MRVARQDSTLRPATTISGFNFPPSITTTSSLATLLSQTATEPSQTGSLGNGSALNNAAHAFFRNKGAMAGVFTAAGLLVAVALVLCFTYRRRARSRAQYSVEDQVGEASFAEKHEAVLDLHARTGTTFPLGQRIQSYIHHPFASPELSISGASTPSTMVHDQMERRSMEKGSQSLGLPASPSLEDFKILGASNYYLSANVYLPSHPLPPPLISAEARRQVRIGEKGNVRGSRGGISIESIVPSKRSSKHISSKSSRHRSISSKHRSTTTSITGSKHLSTTSSIREEREWWWNRRRVRTTKVADEWAIFRAPDEGLSTDEWERRRRETVEWTEFGETGMAARNGEFDEEVTGRGAAPVLPLLPFQEVMEPEKKTEDLGTPVGVSRASRMEMGSRRTPKEAQPPSRKKSSTGSRKTKNRDARASEAFCTLADALTHCRPLESDELGASGPRVRSPFVPSSSSSPAQLTRNGPSPSVDLHPYAR